MTSLNPIGFRIAQLAMTHAVEPFNQEITDQAVRDAINGIAIPSCPTIIVKLSEAIRANTADLETLSRLISSDVGLAASVLRLANSPFFRLRTKVQAIRDAIAVLGLRNLLTIAYGATLQQSLRQHYCISMDRFWNRSMYKPIVTASLNAYLSKPYGDNAYTFGLFADTGIPVLMQRFANYKDTLVLANSDPTRFTRLEDERHHISHTIIGAMLACDWHLPSDVYIAIAFHHSFSTFENPVPDVTTPVRDLVAIGLIADYMVSQFLGLPHDTEWQSYGRIAANHLGLTDKHLAELYLTITPELEEARTYYT